MNPVFIFIVILLAALLWFLLSFMFKPIGKLFYRLWEDAKENMTDESDGK